MLIDLNLKAIYDSSEHDLIKDLLVPLLKNSTRYDRGVGFFSSKWLKIASPGLSDLAEKGGKIRLVISPIISEEDWEAMIRGNEAKFNKILFETLMKTVADLEGSLEETPLNALSWLIADDVLSIKFAIPKGRLEGGDFHDKFAIFEDKGGNRVAIHGSYNDTAHASLNGEAFSVFKSWVEGQVHYVNNHDKRFASLWYKRNRMFDIYDIPEAVKDRIVRCRSKERPYLLPGLKDKKSETSSLSTACKENEEIELREYQLEALESWENAKFRGIFEMATGTGKTITALACASKVVNTQNHLFLIVSVPYLHLLEQWQREMQKFGFHPVLCSSANPGWVSALQLKIQDFNLGFNKIICCVVTHKTASTQRFQDILNLLKERPTMAIYDEVHHIGASRLSNALSGKIKYRIGLSATPQRWYDITGTQVLMEYFQGVCFSFPLEEAIGEFLVEYHYIPHIIELTDEEFEQYRSFTLRISKIFKSKENINDNPLLESLLRERAKVINNAEGKFSNLQELLKDELKGMEPDQHLSHVLFYCPVGSHLRVLRIIADHGIRAREFVYSVKYDARREILEHFANGDIQALVAIKCLDEGVDVPATRKAFILASTTNPREFIQRRGRILRKHEDKKDAIIHDFIVVPPLKKSYNSEAMEDLKKSVLRREMPRFVEFSSAARNEFEARERIIDILNRFDQLYLLNCKPWAIYSDISPEFLDLEKPEGE
jgi:superfamily II DNA or RNA helicase